MGRGFSGGVEVKMTPHQDPDLIPGILGALYLAAFTLTFVALAANVVVWIFL